MKWPHILGDFCFFPFPSHTDGLRERDAPEAGFSGSITPEQMLADQAVMHILHFFFFFPFILNTFGYLETICP